MELAVPKEKNKIENSEQIKHVADSTLTSPSVSDSLDDEGETAADIIGNDGLFERKDSEQVKKPDPPSMQNADKELDDVRPDTDDGSLSVPLVTDLRMHSCVGSDVDVALASEEISEIMHGSVSAKDKEPESTKAEAESCVEKIDVCVICMEPVPLTGDFTVTTGCCNTRHHLTCLLGTNWMPSSKGIICPLCSYPDDEPSVKARTEIVKKTYLAEHGLRRRSTIDNGLISALYNHMVRNATNGGFRAAFNMWSTGNVTHGFRFMAENNVTLDDLLSLNFGLDTIKRHVATTFDQLVSIGFAPRHLKRLETQLPELITLYGINIHVLRSTLGSTLFTVSRIIDLGLGASAMASLGITTHQLCLMGMTKIRIPDFQHISMQEWVNVLGFRKCHIRLLRIKQADFSRMLKPVHWNYIGLKHLLKISDDEAASLGMTDALNKYTTSRKGSSRSSFVSGNEGGYPRRRSNASANTKGRLPSDRNRKSRRNSFKQFEEGSSCDGEGGRRRGGLRSPPRLSLRNDFHGESGCRVPYPPKGWTQQSPVQTAARASNYVAKSFIMGGTTYFPGEEPRMQAPHFIPPSYPRNYGHRQHFTANEKAESFQRQRRASLTPRPRFIAGRPPVNHQLKKKLNKERKAAGKGNAPTLTGSSSGGY